MKTTTVYALTTVDNPFNPFTQFDQWFTYDEGMGYHSCAYLARVANTSEGLSPSENIDEINRAIDEIVRLNTLGIYKRVAKSMPEVRYTES